MEPKRIQPMNTSASWTQPWPVQIMDEVQLEMLIQDVLFDEDDTRIASEMLNNIGICT